jgi:hypothetical protein
MASMVVDGQRSLEQVESELRQKLLISQDDPLGTGGVFLAWFSNPMKGNGYSNCQLNGLRVMGQC